MVRFFISAFLALALVVTSVLSVCAKDIYVNNATGRDRNLGQSGDTADGLSGPVRTIMRAIELSGQGDRIILAQTDTPYRETICLFGGKQSGDSFNAFTIEGNGAVLDGTEMLPIAVWRHAFGNTFRFKPSKFTHFQLFESGLPLKRVAVEPGAKTPPLLNQMEWCICDGFLYVCLENFKRPQDYRFTYSEKMTGMTIMQTNNVRINDLIVQGYQVDGISVVNNTKNVTFDNVVVRGNGRNGLTIGASSTVSVGYSLFGDNNAAQIDMAERSELLLFLSELKESDELENSAQSSPLAQNSSSLAQWVRIINNGGTLREIGPDGVQASEASQKPDIANLWGKLIPASLLNQPTSTQPSTLTSTARHLGGESPSQTLPPTSPDATSVSEPMPIEQENSPFQFNDKDHGTETPFGASEDDSPFNFEDNSFDF